MERKEETRNNEERNIRPRGRVVERILVVNVSDTHDVINILRKADHGLRLLRSNFMRKEGFDVQDVEPLIRNFNAAVEALHVATRDMCEKTGVNYRPPARFRKGE